jgi:8-oxo-dGTP diphosphatase
MGAAAGGGAERATGPRPQTGGPLREWMVAGGIVEVDGRVLLVENLRRNGRTDWSTPGGVVESGEEALVGLTREVAEETGLEVAQWSSALYSVETVAPELGWHLRVQVFRAMSWSGHVSTGSDPDGIVIGARFADRRECEALLAEGGQWVREPLLAWMAERWDDHRAFRYLLSGTSRDTMTVTRR